MLEIWKDIPGYEGYYQVSNLGNFKSLDRIINYKHGLKRLYPGKSLLLEPTKDNYRRIVLMKNHIKVRYMAHRLVALSFISNPNNLPIINHKDGCKWNNNVDNLEWCTYSENSQHATKTGLQKPELNIPSNSKAVKCLDTGECFATTNKAAKAINVNLTSLSRAIKKGRPCKGFHFIHI